MMGMWGCGPRGGGDEGLGSPHVLWGWVWGFTFGVVGQDEEGMWGWICGAGDVGLEMWGDGDVGLEMWGCGAGDVGLEMRGCWGVGFYLWSGGTG